MRTRKYRLVTRAERLSNRTIRWALERGVAPATWALLETMGRRSGRPRHTPVGNGRIGETTTRTPARARCRTSWTQRSAA